MKNSIILLSLFMFLSCSGAGVPCESSVEEEPRNLLAQAKEACDRKDFNCAKILMDSIRRTAPKAFKTLCEVEELYHKVLVEEKTRDVIFYENELERLYALRDSLAKGFDYRKDSRYDDYGVYSHPSQAISKNAGNCFMRATVNADGEAVITSFYRGKRIGHNKIKVSSDGVFVEVDVKDADRPWTGKEYGVYVERYGFKLGNDGGIMKFIVNAKSRIQVELLAKDNQFVYEMRQEDVKAIREVLEFQKVLAAIKETNEMLGAARYSLAYLGQ